MSEFYNCNFKVGDIIIGIEPNQPFTFLKIFRIIGFSTHEEYGRTLVDFAEVEYPTDDGVDTTDIGVSALNHYYRRIVVEEV